MTKKDLFNAINNMDEKYIHDAQDVYKEPQAPEVIRISKEKRQPYWKTIFATAACTAAAMFTVFVPIVRSGAIGSIAPASGTESSASSGAVLSNSGNSESNNVVGSEIKIDLDKEKNYEVVLDSVFAYDSEENTFKRYEWGDAFASDQLLVGGKSYFKKNENGEWQIYCQELALRRFKPLELENVTIMPIKEGKEGTVILLHESLSEKLGLPNFFKTSPNEGDFELYTDKFIGDKESKTISFSSIDITVDYDTNRIKISSDRVTAF